MRIGEGISGAIFSPDRQYRYALWRVWNRERPALIFIGINPSTADEVHDDATVLKVAFYARKWHYGGVYIGNLFALVSRYPDPLFSHRRGSQRKAIGTDNDKFLEELKHVAGVVVVGWGNHGLDSDRQKDVLDLFGKPVYCFGITKRGQPVHPLYLGLDDALEEYMPAPAYQG